MREFEMMYQYPPLNLPNKVRHKVWKKLFHLKFEGRVVAPIVFSIEQGFLEVPNETIKK